MVRRTANHRAVKSSPARCPLSAHNQTTQIASRVSAKNFKSLVELCLVMIPFKPQCQTSGTGVPRRIFTSSQSVSMLETDFYCSSANIPRTTPLKISKSWEKKTRGQNSLRTGSGLGMILRNVKDGPPQGGSSCSKIITSSLPEKYSTTESKLAKPKRLPLFIGK